MSKHSSSCGPTGDRSQDLQQLIGINTLRPDLSRRGAQDAFHRPTDSLPLDDVSSLIRTWAQKRQSTVLDNVELNTWQALSQHLKDSDD